MKKPLKHQFLLEIPSKFLRVAFKSQTANFICYIIYCTKTGKWYFGSGISGRVWKHFLKSKHHNKQLYADFVEFGAEAFKFWIYDCESKEDSLFQEQILLDLIPKVSSGDICNSNCSYNMAINVGGGNTYYPNNPNDLRNNKETKPFEQRNAITHKLIASFTSSNDAARLGLFETLKAQSRITRCLNATRGPACFWDFGVLCYLCLKNETVKEMELRTGRCFESDVAAKLRTIPEITITNGIETHHLKGDKTYYEAARMIGLPKTQWGNFGKMIQGKYKSCDSWRVI